ncbi:MAG: GFA family protein [Pseudomonadota bacterium]
MSEYKGGCRCGLVRFVAIGEPNRIGVCHCLDCRKHSGTPFGASAIFPEGQVTIEGETHDYKGRCFCPCCGSPVYARSDDEIEINLGALDSANQFVPTYESWIVHREGWLPEFPLDLRYRRNRADLVTGD